LRPGKKYIFAPLPTKPAEFEVKAGRKIAEEAKLEHLPVCCCYFFVFPQ